MLLLVLLFLVCQAAMLIVQVIVAYKEKGSAAGQQATAAVVGCGVLWSTLSAWGKRITQMEEMGRAIRRGRKALTL